MAVGWQEGVLARMQQSFYSSIVPGDRWEARAVFGVGAGFEVASLQDLVAALAEPNYPTERRDQCRHLHVLMVRPESGASSYAAGAFLTENDAQEAQTLFAPNVHDCWIEWVPVALTSRHHNSPRDPQ